jgi:UDP-N-acetylmuramate--alanine ligase
MSLKDVNKIYFIGIGGIGMSAIARYFNAIGKQVAGYDKTETKLTSQLQAEGIDIHFEDDINLAPKDAELIVYTPAVPDDHSEYRYFLSNHYKVLKRSEILGLITKDSFTVAVAGTHGKTTTSSIVAHLLKQSSVDCNAFLGGITQNYNSNLILSEGANNTVVEADEYDRSFLTLFPNISVITSVDADHLDIYGDANAMVESYQLFADQLSDDGTLIINKKINDLILTKGKTVTYGIDCLADYVASGVRVESGSFVFDIVTPSKSIRNIRFGVPGRHNIENAVAAVAAADMMGVSCEEIKVALENFKGIKRRFEYIINNEDVIYIDDYAHHPVELTATISSVRELYPDKKVTGVFQPHLYTRTRDFADDFAKSLELLNEVIVLDIYPAREEPIEGVNAEMLLKRINIKNKKNCSKQNLVAELSNRRLEVLLTLGAGDIDKLIEPIRKELLN